MDSLYKLFLNWSAKTTTRFWALRAQKLAGNLLLVRFLMFIKFFSNAPMSDGADKVRSTFVVLCLELYTLDLGKSKGFRCFFFVM